jgi:ribA/ribD-fused uncharacterized protein
VSASTSSVILVINDFSGKYHFLSNFFLRKIRADKFDFPSTENAYQAFKTLDKDVWLLFTTTPPPDPKTGKPRKIMTPGQAKKAGKRLELRADWDEVKVNLMATLLVVKFSYEDLALKLVQTGDAELIEGNYWHDNFWGNCTCAKCENIPGQNHLGKLLMMVRKELQG